MPIGMEVYMDCIRGLMGVYGVYISMEVFNLRT